MILIAGVQQRSKSLAIQKAAIEIAGVCEGNSDSDRWGAHACTCRQRFQHHMHHLQSHAPTTPVIVSDIAMVPWAMSRNLTHMREPHSQVEVDVRCMVLTYVDEVHIVEVQVRCMVLQYHAMHVDEVQVPQRSYIDPWYVIGAPTVIGAFTVILESSFNEIM